MRWDENYPYTGRQQPATRSMVRRTVAVNVGGNRKGFERGVSSGRFREEFAVPQTDYLMHHGIPGMQWGKRRFQNPDGTLTEEGKKRYGKDGSEKEPESKTWKKSDASQLSDDEIRRRNNRLQAERQYRDLTTTQSERDKAQADQMRAQLKNEIKKDFLKKALILPVAGILAYAGTKFIKNHGVKMVDMMEKYGKQAVSKIKSSERWMKMVQRKELKAAGRRASANYIRKYPEGIREYFPRKGDPARNFWLVERNPPLWRKAAKNWPGL